MYYIFTFLKQTITVIKSIDITSTQCTNSSNPPHSGFEIGLKRKKEIEPNIKCKSMIQYVLHFMSLK